jgi:oligoribonuclease
MNTKKIPKSSQNLIWIDLEMTGLDPDKDRILEIATVITDKHLTVLAEGPVIAIHQSEKVLSLMDAWNKEHHGKSGLIERVRKSKISTRKAEQLTLEFISQYVPPKKSPICGNSICQDRRFLYRYMSELEKYFHYRNLDVSTVKILAQRWFKHIAKGITKKSKHSALSDIHDSLYELNYYKEHMFR